MYKVVVQISDADGIGRALTSCRNLINELPDAEVELVFHQTAIRAVVKGSDFSDQIIDLMREGVSVVACRNSMRSNGIGEEELMDKVKVVNAGVAEIIRKQAEGWSYLKL